MSKDGLTWIKHDGGRMPVPGDTMVTWDIDPSFHHFNHRALAESLAWDIITRYAIVTPSPSAVASEPAIDAHYTKHAIEPMEYSMANKLDAMQHTVVKYVTRFRDKHGKRDLLAARHILDKLIAREYPNG